MMHPWGDRIVVRLLRHFVPAQKQNASRVFLDSRVRGNDAARCFY